MQYGRIKTAIDRWHTWWSGTASGTSGEGEGPLLIKGALFVTPVEPVLKLRIIMSSFSCTSRMVNDFTSDLVLSLLSRLGSGFLISIVSIHLSPITFLRLFSQVSFSRGVLVITFHFSSETKNQIMMKKVTCKNNAINSYLHSLVENCTLHLHHAEVHLMVSYYAWLQISNLLMVITSITKNFAHLFFSYQISDKKFNI